MEVAPTDLSLKVWVVSSKSECLSLSPALKSCLAGACSPWKLYKRSKQIEELKQQGVCLHFCTVSLLKLWSRWLSVASRWSKAIGVYLHSQPIPPILRPSKQWYEHSSPHQLSDKACKQGGLSGWKIWIVEPQNMLHLNFIELHLNLSYPRPRTSVHLFGISLQWPASNQRWYSAQKFHSNEIRASCSWLSSTSFRHCAMHCSNCIVLKAGSYQNHTATRPKMYTTTTLHPGEVSNYPPGTIPPHCDGDV